MTTQGPGDQPTDKHQVTEGTEGLFVTLLLCGDTSFLVFFFSSQKGSNLPSLLFLRNPSSIPKAVLCVPGYPFLGVLFMFLCLSNQGSTGSLTQADLPHYQAPNGYLPEGCHVPSAVSGGMGGEVGCTRPSPAPWPELSFFLKSLFS